MTRDRSLVVSLHDVSPVTRAPCDAILEELQRLGVSRTSLLVVPNHHRRGSMLDAPSFGKWLCTLASAGHEIVIHGYYHARERRPAESLRDRITTRFYTADEGEFYDLSREEARRLVVQAQGEFRQLGLAPEGFIAPAWLLGAEAEEALRDLSCAYTTRLGSVCDLRRGETFASQSLVWSVRSGWRRQMSLGWNALLFRRLAAHPLLRVSIHPVDLAHVTIWQQIRALLTRALADREPLTYLAWLNRQRAS
jgi:predicted deacetylase